MSTLFHALRLPRPSWIVETPIAHRGLHDEVHPENTMAAFEAAAGAGYAIELDVHLSRDGEVVVFHDSTLDRLTGHTGDLAARSWAELRGMAIAGGRETIPSLSMVLELVDDRVPVVVEVKNEGQSGQLESAVTDVLRQSQTRCCVQSFNPKSLLWFLRHAPEFPRGLLSTNFVDEPLPRHEKTLLRNLLLVPVVRPAYIGYDLRCLPYWAPSAARRVGIPLLTWTIQTDDELSRARALSDNVIFEGVRP